jgi:uncharacterized protein YdeI (YjbR/CyaY-like superfamily)
LISTSDDNGDLLVDFFYKKDTDVPFNKSGCLNMEPTFFQTKNQFRKWFEANHLKEKELLVGFYKVGSGKPSITWPESVDEALCFGWIDGIRKSLDDESYTIRFTPRKPGSIWSAINIKKVEMLSELGLMHPAGIAAFQKRSASKSAIYAYEKIPVPLDKQFEKRFKANKKAWTFFNALAPSYKRSAINWVMSAKQEATRLKRMNTLIKDSEEGLKIKPLRYP